MMLLLEDLSHHCHVLENETTFMHIFWATISQFKIFLSRSLCNNLLIVPEGQRILREISVGAK